jgi:antitoxin component YwqK of YwqJK toxin-antitoxin module
MKRIAHAALGWLLCLPGAWAVPACSIGGQPVNPANGATTAGKTGLMRCLDGPDGPLLREEELRNGRFVGAVRTYRDGLLHQDYSVNERGNRHGLQREYAASKGANPLLQEQTFRDGTGMGVARAWYHSGRLRSISFHGPDGREQAAAEFTEGGELRDLRCAPQPLLGPDVDDIRLCGHAGVSTVEFRSSSSGGAPGARATFEAGVRTRYETLFANGRPRDQQERQGALWIERSFNSDGTRLHETQWALAGTQRRKLLEQEFHESGRLQREQRFTDGELRAESLWYANGQPRSRNEIQRVGSELQRYVREYHDNGQPAFEGLFKLQGRYNEQPIGVHRRFDDAGRLRMELHHDARGRVTRERKLNEDGSVASDEELYEDGLRKSRKRAP